VFLSHHPACELPGVRKQASGCPALDIQQFHHRGQRRLIVEIDARSSRTYGVSGVLCGRLHYALAPHVAQNCCPVEAAPHDEHGAGFPAAEASAVTGMLTGGLELVGSSSTPTGLALVCSSAPPCILAAAPASTDRLEDERAALRLRTNRSAAAPTITPAKTPPTMPPVLLPLPLLGAGAGGAGGGVPPAAAGVCELLRPVRSVSWPRCVRKSRLVHLFHSEEPGCGMQKLSSADTAPPDWSPPSLLMYLGLANGRQQQKCE